MIYIFFTGSITDRQWCLLHTIAMRKKRAIFYWRE